jgi:glycerophosphoryl diester phosphodiesterase
MGMLLRLITIKKVVSGALLAMAMTVFAYLYRNPLREWIDARSIEFAGEAFVSGSSHTPPEYIAHGGGMVNGIQKSNSLDALDANYELGFRYFELDFNWTSDGELVAIHDWSEAKVETFGGGPGVFALSDFKGNPTRTGLKQLTIDDVASWLRNGHGAARIVTDIKDRNLDALELIALRYPDIRDRFVPQVYRFPEILSARKMGFQDIIMTLYASEYSEDGVMAFVERQKPFALTIPPHKVTAQFLSRLESLSVMTYTHGINDSQGQALFRALGVRGFYCNQMPVVTAREE